MVPVTPSAHPNKRTKEKKENNPNSCMHLYLETKVKNDAPAPGRIKPLEQKRKQSQLLRMHLYLEAEE